MVEECSFTKSQPLIRWSQQEMYPCRSYTLDLANEHNNISTQNPMTKSDDIWWKVLFCRISIWNVKFWLIFLKIVESFVKFLTFISTVKFFTHGHWIFKFKYVRFFTPMLLNFRWLCRQICDKVLLDWRQSFHFCLQR